MHKRTLGKTGMQVTVLGFGGAEVGFEGAAQETVTRLLNAALDAGLNVIDTAECYANSEGLIGQAVAHRRHDYFLFTKCGHDGKSFGLPDWDPRLLEQTIERSLTRLKTDCLDLIQLHSCSADVLAKGEVVEVLQKAQAAGKTRFLGYSGDNADAVYAVRMGVFATLQTSVNIADQANIDLGIQAAAAAGMGVIAKRPIANATWRNATRPVGTYGEPYWVRLQDLKYGFLGGEHAFATALKFTLSVPGVTTAIVGTTKPQRWVENAAMVGEGRLPAGEYEAIRRRWKDVAQGDWVGQT